MLKPKEKTHILQMEAWVAEPGELYKIHIAVGKLACVFFTNINAE